MRVLVTGGAGYIGSHTCKLLSKTGHIPITVDNLVAGRRDFVRWGPFYPINIEDSDKVSEIIKFERVEAVIHFAAYAYVGESVEKPLKYYSNNTAGTISLLKAMDSCLIRKLVFSSTCATYGIPLQVPISEEFEQKPINPYGNSKFMIEQILKDLVNSGGWSITSLRYFNAAGGDRDAEIGELHDPETHLIPLAIRAAHDPNYELTIYGSDYSTKDGSCIRDFVHVEDLADVHVKALEWLGENKIDFFNVGAGEGTSIFEIIQLTEEVTGKKLKVSVGRRRPGDPPVLVADISKARSELKWSPRNSDIRNIIKTANEWYLKCHQKNLKNT